MLSSVLSGREDFGIYVLIFGLSSVVSGREGFLAIYRAKKKQVYPLLIREVFVLFVWYQRNLQNG